jgi:hypothetical protein
LLARCDPLPKGLGRTRLDGLRSLPRLRTGEVARLRRFEEHLDGIRIEVSDLSQAHDLADFLRGLCFDVRLVGERRLEARFRKPLPPDKEAGQLELDLYLRVWAAIHPEGWAVRVE